MPPRKSGTSSISQSLRASSVKSASASSGASAAAAAKAKANFFKPGAKSAQGKGKAQSQQEQPKLQQEQKEPTRSASHSSLSSVGSSASSASGRSLSPEKRSPSAYASTSHPTTAGKGGAGSRTSSSGSASASASAAPLSTLSREQRLAAESLPPLDVSSPSLNGIWRTTQREKLGLVGPIHAEGDNRVHHILRAFDLDPSYGPCLGLTRLERWNRAKRLGEEPPVEVFEILNTREGTVLDEYRENCLAGAGV